MNKLIILIAFLLVGCTNSIYLKKDQVTDIYMTMPDTAYELLNKRLPEGTKKLKPMSNSI